TSGGARRLRGVPGRGIHRFALHRSVGPDRLSPGRSPAQATRGAGTRAFAAGLRWFCTLCAVTERTLVLIKPDGVERQLIGEIISRIERKGLNITALELRQVSGELASRHYAEHEGKPFFGSLLEFITSGPVVAAIVEGPRAVAAVRQL